MGNLKKSIYHWDEFSSNLQELISEDVLCDVTLISEGKRLPASRIVLSACSDYFKTMFTGSFKERDCKDVQINDVGSDDLPGLLKVCYTGALDINSDNSESLLRGAHFLQIRTAISICCEYILENLSPENCVRFWLLARHLMLKEVEAKVFEYSGHNFSEIPHSGYVELNAADLDEFIKNPELRIHEETGVLDVVMNWFQHEPNTRMEHISKLAGWVDFNFVEHTYFSKYLQFLFQFNEAQEFLQHIFNFYFSPTSKDVSVHPTRNTAYVPLSLSTKGCVSYQKVHGKWIWSTFETISAVIKNFNDVIALHSDNTKLYIARKRPGYSITIESCDMENTSLASRIIDTPYSEAALAFSHSFVYLVGRDTTICGFNLLTQKNGGISDIPMSVARTSPGVIVLNKKLYVIGGESRPNGYEYSVQIHNSTECFSIKNKTWKNCAPLLHPVSDMGISTLNGKIYVVGGVTGGSWDYNSQSRTITAYTDKFQCYDPLQDTWTYLGNFISECFGIKMCIWNGLILASGGTHRTGSNNENVYCYKSVDGKWKIMGSAGHVSTHLFTARYNIFLINSYIKNTGKSSSA